LSLQHELASQTLNPIEMTHRIHERIDTPAKLTPFCSIALLDKTWPIKAKQTTTKLNSIVLARNAVNKAAEEGEN
jgi:hypothetical protein